MGASARLAKGSVQLGARQQRLTLAVQWVKLVAEVLGGNLKATWYSWANELIVTSTCE